MNKILVFSASWCAPCKAHKANLTNNNIPFESIDVDDNDELVNKYKIRSVPTTMVVSEDGEIVLSPDGTPMKYTGAMLNVDELTKYVSN